jgi:hypothetical protein
VHARESGLEAGTEGAGRQAARRLHLPVLYTGIYSQGKKFIFAALFSEKQGDFHLMSQKLSRIFEGIATWFVCRKFSL